MELFPFRKPTASDIEYFGGISKTKWIWSIWMLPYFNDLEVGETASPACFLRENAKGAGMPPPLSH